MTQPSKDIPAYHVTNELIDKAAAYLSWSIFFALISLISLGFLIFKSYQVGIYKSKYESSLTWIEEGLPLDGRPEIMRAIREVIEDKK